MHTWTFLEKIRRCAARYGGFYIIVFYWKITNHRRSRTRAIILNAEKNKILLVKNITSKEFHLPGGGIEKGEDAEKAIVREAYEELGIHINIMYHLGKYLYPNTKKHVTIFVAEVYTPHFKMQWELDDAAWFAFTDLPNINKTTKQALRDFLARNEPVVGIWG